MSYNPKSFRKFLASSVSMAIVATSAVAFAPVSGINVQAEGQDEFTDIKEGSIFYEAVQYLKEKDIVNGFGDNTFRPHQTLTRAEAAKMIAVALELDTENVETPAFTDLEEKWYFNYVAALANEKIVSGYGDNTYRPGNHVLRSEVAKMLTTAYGVQASAEVLPFTDVDSNKWYAAPISGLFETKITTGTTETLFSPGEKVTRGQMALFLYRSEQKLEKLQYKFEGGFDSFVAGVENTFSIKAKATNVSQDTNVRYRATLLKDGEAVADEAIQYEAATDQWATFTTDADGVAYFGPEAGFKTEDIGLENGVTTNFKATISETGSYSLKVELVDVATEKIIGRTGQITFTVEGAKVGFEFESGFDSFVAGVENTFSVKATATNVPQDKNVRYRATLLKGDEAVADAAIQYEVIADVWDTFSTDADGVAYFGPEAGFKTEEIGLEAGLSTYFKASLKEAGDYTLTIELVDADNNEIVGEEGEVKFTVAEPVTFTFTGLENLTVDEEFLFSIAAQLNADYNTDDMQLRYKAVFTKVDGDDLKPVAELVVNYNELEKGEEDFQSSFETNADGVAFFGPATGLSELAIAAIKGDDAVESEFKATIAEAGVYKVVISLVNVDAAGVVLADGTIGSATVTFEVK